jgi:hypothetical protein
LLDIEDDKVAFRWKDYRDNNREKIMVLPAEEFIRRFLRSNRAESDAGSAAATQYQRQWLTGKTTIRRVCSSSNGQAVGALCRPDPRLEQGRQGWADQ